MDGFAIDRSDGRDDGEVGSEQLQGRAGQVLIVPANTPHKFTTGPNGYEGVHIHANPRFVTEWLE
jgi:quercetin dioxygenase-like cupin family protein